MFYIILALDMDYDKQPSVRYENKNFGKSITSRYHDYTDDLIQHEIRTKTSATNGPDITSQPLRSVSRLRLLRRFTNIRSKLTFFVLHALSEVK